MIRLQPNYFSASGFARRLMSLPLLCLAALSLIPALAPPASWICAGRSGTAHGNANAVSMDRRLIDGRPGRLIRIHSRSVIAAPVTPQPTGPQTAGRHIDRSRI